MTGGDIYNSIYSNMQLLKVYSSDEMFADIIDSIIETADEGDVEMLSDKITRMAYNFMSTYNAFINLISESNDTKLIDESNKLINNFYDNM